MSGYRYMHLDVMEGERFVCTLHMKYCPAFKVTMEQVEDFVFAQRPSLKNKKCIAIVMN